MYYTPRRIKQHINNKKFFIVLAIVVFLAAIIPVVVIFLRPQKPSKVTNYLHFDDTVTESEQQQIITALTEHNKVIDRKLTFSVKTTNKTDDANYILSAYVPVTGLYSARQKIAQEDLAQSDILLNLAIDEAVSEQLIEYLNNQKTAKYEGELDLSSNNLMLIPAKQMSSHYKLLSMDDAYYLDDFTSGAIFRVVQASGDGVESIAGIRFNKLPNKDEVLKVNMSGVTAFTRLMMRKLNQVGDPLYFSKYIGPFLRDGDIVHTSNEVSFQQNCQYHDAVFCADPRFIDTIKDSGINLIELTGNHNNDVGAQFNASTIKLYHELGISTFGGGVNSEEARKPFVADKR